MARIFALIARVHRVLHRVSCSYETIPNAPKYYKGPVGWIGCVRCKKSRHHFVARTLALIAPIHRILHRVSCSYEMIPNAPKYYEGPMGWIGCVRCEKIPMSLRGTNFCINCTSSPYFAPSFMQLRNDPKCTQTLWNTHKHEFRIQWGGSGAFVGKNYNVTSWHELLH